LYRSTIKAGGLISVFLMYFSCFDHTHYSRFWKGYAFGLKTTKCFDMEEVYFYCQVSLRILAELLRSMSVNSKHFSKPRLSWEQYFQI